MQEENWSELNHESERTRLFPCPSRNRGHSYSRWQVGAHRTLIPGIMNRPSKILTEVDGGEGGLGSKTGEFNGKTLSPERGEERRGGARRRTTVVKFRPRFGIGLIGSVRLSLLVCWFFYVGFVHWTKEALRKLNVEWNTEVKERMKIRFGIWIRGITQWDD